MGSQLFFADAESSFEEAYFVILGVPFDGTCSHRKGARSAPKTVREESYSFETYLFEHDIDLEDVPFHDMGDIVCESLDDMIGGVGNAVGEIVKAEKFPILIGGEHSITPPAIRKLGEVGVIILDAHLDFRNEYLDEPDGHACVSRRVVDLVGVENILTIGVRSMERKEKEESEALGLRYIDAFKLKEMGMKKALENLEWERIYLSLDMDFFDPSFAPGVGNPEFFGFSPEEVKECMNIFGDKLVGFDVTETCPPFDNGNTSSLAARMIREVLAVVWKAKQESE